MILLSIFALIPIEKDYDNNGNNWMSMVSDDTNIYDMSIPGTHDSGAFHSLFDVAGKCQDLSVSKQLEIGVRFLDLRLQMVNNEFNIVHSFVDQNLKFKSVLDDLDKFISNNNLEFIIISIKEDADKVSSNKSFEELLLEYLKEYSNICYDKSLPKTLGEARGKIYILSRYELSFGIPAYNGWTDDDTFKLDNMYIQDNYCIDNAIDKKNDIKNTMDYAKKSSNELILNFTSCYLDNAFPPTYAGTIALDINPWLLDVFNNNDKLGIVVCDFITVELSTLIYERNIK
jgi:1-phosphatidylinositol phosphodiesterase